MTPYTLQMNEYELRPQEMTSAEIPQGLVEIRTIDDSPSHEADIVIVDLVRTSKPGFFSFFYRD